MSERSKNLIQCSSDATQKLKQWPIVKFSTCITFNILKTSLKIETAKSQAISIIVFSFDFDSGPTKRPTSELKLSFEFCAYLPRHRFNRLSLLKYSYWFYNIFFILLLRTVKLRWLFFENRLKSHLKIFFMYKTNCISFLRSII